MKPFDDEVYKIYRPINWTTKPDGTIIHNNGEYSSGGNSPRFTKNGKVWRSKGALHSHLNFVSRPEVVYDGCFIVKMVRDGENEYIPLMEYFNKYKENIQSKEMRKLERIRKKYIGMEIVNLWLDRDDNISILELKNGDSVNVKSILEGR